MRIVLNANGANTQHMGHHTPSQVKLNEQAKRNETKPYHHIQIAIPNMHTDMFGLMIKRASVQNVHVHARRKSIHDLPKTQWITFGNVRVQRFYCKYSYGFLSYLNYTPASLSCLDMIALFDGARTHTYTRTHEYTY